MAFANAARHNRLRDKRNSPSKRAAQKNGNGYVINAVLADGLEPLLEALFSEGHTHVAAASPTTVARLACQLERLLVVNGIVPQSKRAEDPQAYARSMSRTMHAAKNLGREAASLDERGVFHSQHSRR